MRHLEDLPTVIEKIICGLNTYAFPRKKYYQKRISFTYIYICFCGLLPRQNTINGVLAHKVYLIFSWPSLFYQVYLTNDSSLYHSYRG